MGGTHCPVSALLLPPPIFKLYSTLTAIVSGIIMSSGSTTGESSVSQSKAATERSPPSRSPSILTTARRTLARSAPSPAKIRIVKKVVTPNNTLMLAITATTLAQQLAAMAPVPGASAAVSVMLLVLDSVQKVQTNQDACWRLAKRAARILLDINEQMEGRWDSAPPLLLKNLEKFRETLLDVYEFMRSEVESKWHSRFLRQASIADTLDDFNARLDDASQSFQIATLINIHYIVTSSTLGRVTEPTKNEISRIPQNEATLVVDELVVSPLGLPLNNGKGSSCPHGAKERKASSIMEVDQEMTVPQVSEMGYTSAEEVESSSQLSSEGEELQHSKDYLLTGALAHATLEDDHGFRRYHQSQIKLLGRSQGRKGSQIVDKYPEWYEGTQEVLVDGQKALIKRYSGPDKVEAAKAWARDVIVLSNVYHQNLPQMIGYSNDLSPTKFILLSNMEMKNPQSLMMYALRSRGIASVVDLLLRFYSDIIDAVEYIQNQLDLSESQMQDFVEDSSLRIEEGKTVIMALPKPRDGRWLTARNYGLTETVRTACFQMLPNRGRHYKLEDTSDMAVDLELRMKINHIALLMEDLLPNAQISFSLPDRVTSLMNEYDEVDAPITSLRQLRLSNLSVNLHEQTWRAAPIVPYMFEVGDLVYFPDDKYITANGLKSFQGSIKICNILNDANWLSLGPFLQRPSWNVLQRMHAVQQIRQPWPSQWTEAHPFDVSHDTKCIAVPVPARDETTVSVVHERVLEKPVEAWMFLINNAHTLAKQAGVRLHDLMLVTRVGTDQYCSLRDFSSPQSFHPHASSIYHGSGHNFSGSGFQPMHSNFGHHHGHNMGFHQLVPQPPAIFYLVTSYNKEHTPFFSSVPTYLPPGTSPPQLPSGYTYRFQPKWGFVNYVQLHPEDSQDN